MYLSEQASKLWRQMIQNLNAPDWASRHLYDNSISPLASTLNGDSDTPRTSLEIAMSQMGLLARQSEIQPPSR